MAGIISEILHRNWKNSTEITGNNIIVNSESVQILHNSMFYFQCRL